MFTLQTARTIQNITVNHGTKITELPDLTVNLLRDENYFIDNLFADLWKHADMKVKLDRIVFHKRSGTSARAARIPQAAVLSGFAV